MSPAPSGRRLSSGRLPGCQPILFRIPEKFRKNRNLCRTLPWKLGKPGFPRRRREAADVSELADFEKFFKDLRPVELFVVVPAPSGGGYLVAGLLGVNRSF